MTNTTLRNAISTVTLASTLAIAAFSTGAAAADVTNTFGRSAPAHGVNFQQVLITGTPVSNVLGRVAPAAAQTGNARFVGTAQYQRALNEAQATRFGRA